MNIRVYLLSLFIIAASACRSHNTDTRSDSIDIVHTSLSIDVSDFSAKILRAKADITFSAITNGLDYIKFDLLRLTVDSIRSGTLPLSFTYNDSLITISLPAPLAAGQTQVVSIFYHGTPIQMPGDFGGFYWDNLYAFNIGVSFLAEPHNYGKAWFPCFDNFVERSTFHFAITTDSSRRAMCNGTEDSVSISSLGLKTWHWTMSDAIPSYLASMSVSNYAVIRDTFHALNGTLPILLTARPGDTINLKRSFSHLKNALSIFESRFGPYIFNRVGYCVVPFTAGAMEHATNISYMHDLVNGNTAYENVMAHELSHHWFGDMATCDNEDQMWMNEGWARYCEEIFYEGLYGRAHYNIDIRDNHEDVIRMAHIADSAYWALSGIPSKLTYSNYSVYEKGADRVHTLRSYMGDSLFFGCLKSYLIQYKLKSVNSYEMRDYLVSCSGLTKLNDFFADWIFDGGFPDFSIENSIVSYTPDGYEVTIYIRQRSDHTSHYFNNVPLEIAYFDSLGSKTVMLANVSGNCTQYTATLPFNPAYIALDFDEKLSDAVTDQWFKMAGVNHLFDFGVAKMIVHMAQSSDSTLLRVEHHWVAPDASKNYIQGLHLSDYRYWNVDGIWSSDFSASATLYYNGTNNAQGYLDNTFISNSEDSMVLMYRPDAQSAWQIDTDVIHSTGGNATDKLGYFTINYLQKGQYAMAIYDARRTDPVQVASACTLLSVADISAGGESFKAYPNPVHTEELNIETDGRDQYIKCIMINMIGETVVDRSLKEGQNKFKIYMNGLPRGTYMISLIDKDNRRISKKIQKLN